MSTTTDYITRFEPKVARGKRGFPGPAGPVSGGSYPGAGIAVSTGSAWGSSYSTSGSGSTVALTAGPTFTGTVTMGSSTVIPNGGTIGQAAGPLLTFDDTNNYLEITGCSIGFGIAAPLANFHFYAGASGLGAFGADSKLAIENNGNAFLQFATRNTDISGIYFGDPESATRGGIYYDHSNDYLRFDSGGSQRMTIKADGTVGFGTTSPNAKAEFLATTEQLRLSYDAAKYTSFTVASSGALTVTPLAGTNFNINLSTTGDFAVNTNHLYVDTSAASVAIGATSTGGYKFKVTGTSHLTQATDVDGIMKHSGFTSGFAGGSKWRIHDIGAAEFESILCRGALNVYELIINRLHYQNGGLIIGHGSGKVAVMVDNTQGAEVVEFHDPNGSAVVPFAVGSIVMIQNVDVNRTTVVKKIVREVDSIDGTEVTFKATAGWTPAADDVGAINIYDEVVAIGHTSTASLQNSIFMTSTDTNNPYLSVFTEVDSYADWLANARLKLMIGNLAKIDSATFGDLTLPASPGYGLFSDNAYLTGRVVLPSAGMTNEGALSSSVRIYAGDTYANRATAKFRVTQNGDLTATGVAELGTNTVNYGGSEDYNCAIKGADIWENMRNADNSAIMVNRIGYNGGTTKYRDFAIYDGKGHKCFSLGAKASPVNFTFGNSADPINAVVYVYGGIVFNPMADPPAAAEEGMVYADTDHHLYYYNGSAWKQLDN